MATSIPKLRDSLTRTISKPGSAVQLPISSLERSVEPSST
jgi:hypothetical protein